MKRLFYLAGVSNDGDIGNYIKEDFVNLKNVLEPFENSGKLILRTDELLTSDILAKRIAESEKCPWLFYFSGHSDEKQIKLVDKSLNINAFASLFDSNKVRNDLQLVFLNSCSSENLGNALISHGVKVVLISLTTISAPFANLMAMKFFNKLMIEQNIGTAFQYAKNFFKMKFDQIDFSNNEDKKVVFPWVLKSSSESNIPKELPKISISDEQKNRMMINELNINMEFDRQIIQFSEENNLKIKKDKMTDNVNNLKVYLINAEEKVDESHSLRNIYQELLKNQTDISPSLDKLVLKANKKIKNVPKPDEIIRHTKESLKRKVSESNKLLLKLEKL